MFKYFAASLTLCVVFSCAIAQKTITVKSPDKSIVFSISTDAHGLLYNVSYKNSLLVKDSRLAIDFKEGGSFSHDLSLQKPVLKKMEEDYELVVGKASKIHSESNQLTVPIVERSGSKRAIEIEVRAFNDGVAFRYHIPEQSQWKSVNITNENNTFNLTNDPQVLTLFRENYTTSHEGIYSKLKLSEVKNDTLMDMPTLFQFPNGTYLAITEAALRDYAGMYLIKRNGVLQSTLSPLPKEPGIKVKAALPHNSPWRVMMISNRVGTLIESNILTNLNEPCKIKDVSWIKPGKTTFPWWNGNVVPDSTFAPGNNYETNMYYVDFCARNNIQYHSVVEYGLHEWYVNDGAGFQPGPHADPSKAVPGLDMQQICDSAKAKGVGIRVWVHFYALYPKLEETFAQYEKWGIKGLMCDFMDRDDQEMVNVQEEILQSAARHHLHIQFHGAYKPTGLNRTYPNEFTREGTLNYENNKWNNSITPDHDINMPFTRMLAGSTDYHLGGFRAVPPSKFKVQYTRPLMMGTRCHMLAMYVVLENYLGMVCDYPDAYIGQPGFEFLQQIPTTWDETKVLDAKVGEYITIARRKGNDWYVGTITNNTGRDIKIPLSFLSGGNYIAEQYSDSAEVAIDPNKLIKTTGTISNESITVKLAPGGGQVMHIYPAVKK